MHDAGYKNHNSSLEDGVSLPLGILSVLRLHRSGAAVTVTEFPCAAANMSEKEFPCSQSCSTSGSYTLPTSSMIPGSRDPRIWYGWLLFKQGHIATSQVEECIVNKNMNQGSRIRSQTPAELWNSSALAQWEFPKGQWENKGQKKNIVDIIPEIFQAL